MGLQSALLEHGAEPAMVLVILGLMGATSAVRIRRCRRMDFSGGAVAPEVLAVFEKYRPRFAGCLDEQIPNERGLRVRYWEEECQVTAYNVLCRMPPYDLQELFTAFVASSLRSGSGFSPALNDAPLAEALAPDLDGQACNADGLAS
ncbi:MAG: hypothetical protein AAF530_11950 [Pseudomonadota bacterium]